MAPKKPETETKPEIDTLNRFAVAVMVGDGSIMIHSPPRIPISPDEARVLAAYLVALSGGEEKFLPVLHAVENA